MAEITLTGEHKKVLVLPVEHPVLSKGSATQYMEEPRPFKTEWRQDGRRQAIGCRQKRRIFASFAGTDISRKT